MTGEAPRFVHFHKAAKPLPGRDDVRYAECTRLFYKQCEKQVEYPSERALLHY